MAVDLDGDRARRVRFATSPDAEGPKIGKRCEYGDGKLRAGGVDAEAYGEPDAWALISF